MVELIIKKYLDEHLDVPSFFEHMGELPNSYVLIEKTSSGKSNHVLSSTVAFQSYAESMYEAAMLNETLKSVVENMIELDSICDIKLNADYNFTDTATKKYRYQSVFDFEHY